MDPDANLTEQRELVRDILEDKSDDLVQFDFVQKAVRLAELVQALDHWLTCGGLLPGDWQ